MSALPFFSRLRGRRGARLATTCALVMLTACGAPRVERSAEIERFQQETRARVAALELDPAKPLTLADCEAIAVKNNLDYRVQLLRARMTDEQVRLAISGFFPRGDLAFAHTRRSNEPLVSMGGPPAAFEDQEVKRFSLRVMIPIFDFGTTYYAWQIAKDRRAQERLAVLRARQTLLRDVRVRYARLAAEQRQAVLWQTAVRAAEELLKVAESLQREGIGSPADTAQVQALVARTARELILARNRALESRLMLAQVLSLPARTDFAIDSALPPLPPLPGLADVARIEDHALRARPELHVQDLQRHIAATEVRKEFAGFLPRLDGLLGFDWSSLSQQVNPAYFTWGYSVAHSLLEGGSRYYRYQLAKRAEPVEQERTLLLATAVLFEVDLHGLQLARAHSNVLASREVVRAQETVLKQVESRFREGLEAGAEVARQVAELHSAMLSLDAAQADYLMAWYELQAAALPDEPAPDAEHLPCPQPTDGSSSGGPSPATPGGEAAPRSKGGKTK